MSGRRTRQKRKGTKRPRNQVAQLQDVGGTSEQNHSRETTQRTLNVLSETPTDGGYDEIDGAPRSCSSGYVSMASVASSVSRPHELLRDSGIDELPELHSRELTPNRTHLSGSQTGTSKDTNHHGVLSSLPTNPDQIPVHDRVSQETSSEIGSGKFLTSATRRPTSLDDSRVQRTSTNQQRPQLHESGSQGAVASVAIDPRLSHPARDFRNASYPQFASRQARLASFTNWPSDHTHRPEDFVDAGLFFAGYADCVRCFYCGLGMKYWRAGDRPVYQHARYRPYCVYIIMYAGQSYVDGVQHDLLSQQASQPASQLSTQAEESTATSQGTTASNGQNYLKEDDVENTRPQTELQRDVDSENRDSGVSNFDDDTDNGGTGGSHHHAGAAQATASAETSEARSEIQPSTSAEQPAKFQLNLQEEMKVVEREHSYLKSRVTCHVCLQRPVNSLYMPCGHVIACEPCADEATRCKVCNKVILGTANIYFA